MDKNLLREIASKGGKAAHAQGTAHKFNSETARAAAKLATPHSREHMVEIGRKGGRAFAAKKRAEAEASNNVASNVDEYVT